MLVEKLHIIVTFSGILDKNIPDQRLNSARSLVDLVHPTTTCLLACGDMVDHGGKNTAQTARHRAPRYCGSLLPVERPRISLVLSSANC